MNPAPARLDTQYQWLLWSLLFISLAFGFLPSGLDWVGTDAEASYTEGSLIRRVQWLPVFGLAAWVCLRRFRLLTVLLPYFNPFLFLFAFWVFASVAWSYEPGITLRKDIQWAGVIVIGLAFQLAAWHPRRLEDVMLPFTAAMLVGSLLVAIVLPSIGRHLTSGDPAIIGTWRGLASHKNSLGALAAVATIFWVHAWAAQLRRPGTSLAMIALALFLMVMARSSTSILGAIVGSAVVLAVLRPPRWLDLRNTVLAGVVLLSLGLLLFALFVDTPTLDHLLAPVAEAFGKDLTFSDRTTIWALVLDEIAQRPWLGSGFGAFWLGAQPGVPSSELLRLLGYEVLQAHNGFLDVVNETGYIGLFLTLGYLLWHLAVLLKLIRVDRVFAAIHLAFFTYLIMSNLAESNLYRTITETSVLHVTSSLMASRLLLQQRFGLLRAQREAAGPVGLPA